MSLEGKNAIVTGAARGIGRAVCLELARRGANVYAIDMDLEGTKKTAEEVAALGVKSGAEQVDVSDSAGVEAYVDKLTETVQHIDVLVNNAGITRDMLILRMTDEEWDKVIDINLKGVFNFTRPVAKVMLRQRSGAIVNLASWSGLHGNPGQGNYSASKAGVIALSKTAAKELAARGVRVNVVAPGFITTAMTDVLSDKIKERVLSEVPLKRFGSADDVAKAVCFLADDGSAYITGHVLQVDGGLGM